MLLLVKTYVGYLKKFWVLKPQTPVFFDFLEMSDKKVVICGGGIIGCSIAYFLTKLGQVKRHFLIAINFSETGKRIEDAI